MRCDNPDCQCLSHVDPSTHVPCCPIHRIPLIRSGDASDIGECPLGRKCGSRGRAFTHDTWTWVPKDNFHGSDLPPANGWLPLEIKEAS